MSEYNNGLILKHYKKVLIFILLNKIIYLFLKIWAYKTLLLKT